MLRNRSMPDELLIPVLSYPSVIEAVDRLGECFGFHLRWRVGTHRAQLGVGAAAAIAIVEGPAPAPGATDHVMVRVEDVHAHRARALAAGVSAGEVTQYPYGESQYPATDFSGRAWVFTQTVLDVAPAEWGGTAGGRR